MTSNADQIVVVGGGQAAAQLLDSIRRCGYQGGLTLVSEESTFPYQRPPLSKSYLSGKQPPGWLLYRPEAFYHAQQIKVVLGKRVVALNPEQRLLKLDDGTQLTYGKLALTTGSRVRKIDLPGSDVAGVFYLRTLADVEKISAQLKPGKRVAIIGGGFIGLEVAATLSENNIQVTVLEAQDRVLARVVAAEVSDFFRHEHERQGVTILTGIVINNIGGGNGQAIRIDCGDSGVVEADLLIIGVGVHPNTELAEQAGLACDNGICVDELAQTSDANIVAAGDCTSHYLALPGKRVRLETVHNAVEQAKTAAATLCGLAQPYRQTPWVWSDQYDLRLQAVGVSTDYDNLVIRGNPDARKFALFYFRNGQFVAMNGVNRPEDFAACRKIINQGIALTPEQAGDPSFSLKALTHNPVELCFAPPWPERNERRQGPLAQLGQRLKTSKAN